MSGEQAIFNLEIKKKSGFSLNPDIHHSKGFSSEQLIILLRILLHFCRRYLIIKKTILKTYALKLMIFNVDVALKLRNYRYMSQINPKKFL